MCHFATREETMKQLIAVLTLAMATVAMAPDPAAAVDARCTTGYVSCLNDTHNLSGWLQRMADIECFAEYSGCVALYIMKS